MGWRFISSFRFLGFGPIFFRWMMMNFSVYINDSKEPSVPTSSSFLLTMHLAANALSCPCLHILQHVSHWGLRSVSLRLKSGHVCACFDNRIRGNTAVGFPKLGSKSSRLLRMLILGVLAAMVKVQQLWDCHAGKVTSRCSTRQPAPGLPSTIPFWPLIVWVRKLPWNGLLWASGSHLQVP